EFEPRRTLRTQRKKSNAVFCSASSAAQRVLALMSNAMLILLVVLAAFVLLPLAMFNWDKSQRSFVLAVRSLWLHKLRAMLSVLGIIICTAAVIALMAFGEGSMQDALADIKRLGATNVMVRSIKPPDDGSITR